jgi:folate-dependent phosphoribosylglycinamide formyltransferase PurN
MIKSAVDLMKSMEKITPIYSGKIENFSWVGFGSGSGTNLRECAKVIKPKMIFCDRPNAKLLSLEELADVPKIVLDGYKACGKRPKVDDAKLNIDYRNRCTVYNGNILDKIRECENEYGFNTNLIVLGGYMRLILDPLLAAFQDKIINVHPADLSILENGKRKYVGDNAVYDAIKAGVISTKSSVIMVDEGTDHGEILTQGQDVLVMPDVISKNSERIKEYAEDHQKLQKEMSDWPALTTALKMIAEGRIALGTEKNFFNEWRTVYVDGKPMGYEGFQVLGGNEK